MANERKKLSDILGAGNGNNFNNTWNMTAAADDYGPLPPGTFTVRILSGELFQSKRNGTPGYKLTCQVTAGDYEGRRLWLDFWLSPAALPMTKRDLAKIGIERPEQLNEAIPPGILLSVKVSLRRDDDGNESNKVQRFECIGFEPGDAFEPRDAPDMAADAPVKAADAPVNKPEDFPFGVNAPPSDGDAPKPPSNNGPTGGSNRAGPSPEADRIPPSPKRGKNDAEGQQT
jgi:hypothetical protein